MPPFSPFSRSLRSLRFARAFRSLASFSSFASFRSCASFSLFVRFVRSLCSHARVALSPSLSAVRSLRFLAPLCSLRSLPLVSFSFSLLLALYVLSFRSFRVDMPRPPDVPRRARRLSPGRPSACHNPLAVFCARGQPEATGNPSHEPSEARQRRRPIRPMVTAGRSLHVAGGPSGAVQRHRSDSDAPPPCTLGRWVGPSERSTIEQRRQHRGARIRRRRSGHADTTAPRMDVVGSIDARCLSAAAASVGTSGQRVQRPSRRRSTTTGASRRTSRTQHARTAVSDQVDTAGPGGQARANRRTGLPPNGGSGGPKPPGGFDVRLGYRRV
ncbi:hypothetical protein ES703_41126 [subsurface metagenome]